MKKSSVAFWLGLASTLGAVTGLGCGGGSSKHAVDAGPPLPKPAWDWAGVIGTGQSLAVGQWGVPASAAAMTPMYGNLMLSVGTPPYSIPPFDPTSATLSMVPLVEYMRTLATTYPQAYPGNIYGETPHTAMANEISSLYLAAAGADAGGAGYVTAHTEVGENGQGYIEIMKGAVDTGTMGRAYAASIFEAEAITNLAATAGKSYGVGAIIITHGENDAGNTAYEADLVQLWSDYNNDLKAITGQTASIPMLVSQQHSSPPPANGPTSASTLAQWMVGLDHPGDIICIGPKYQYPYSQADGANTHLTTAGYEMLGEKYAQVYFDKVVLGQNWQPLQPISVDVNANVINVHFHVPTPPLQWVDDSVLPPPQQAVAEWVNGKGFEVSAAGPAATIDSVQIVGDDTVQITCSPSTSFGGISSVGYAFTANATAMPNGTYRWGQLSDSDVLVGATSQTTQANHAVSFQVPLPSWTAPGSP